MKRGENGRRDRAPVLRLDLWLLKRLGQALGAVKDFFLWTFSFPRGN